MNVTTGSEFAFGLPLWINSTNVTFMDFERNENYSTVITPVDADANENSTVPNFVDLATSVNHSTVPTGIHAQPTVPTKELEFPEVVFELKWLEPLDLYLKGVFIILAVLMVVYVVGRKVVAHVRMRFGRDFSVNFRLGDWRRDDADAVSNTMRHAGGVGGKDVGREGRNVALRNFV